MSEFPSDDSDPGRDSAAGADLARQVERLGRIVDLLNETACESLTRHGRLLEKLEQQLLDLETGSGRGLQAEPGTLATHQTDSHPAGEVPPAGERGVQTVRPDGDPSTKSWQQQRDEMMRQMDQDEKPAFPIGETCSSSALATCAGSLDSISLEGASADILAEVNQLKDQLMAAMRDAEVELSRERARMSNEKVAYEKRIAELEQRERDLTQRAAAGPNQKDGRVSRLRRFLGRK